MKLKSNKSKNSFGFTIVEVMIVLAIAGIIMAIVFVAIPELQVSVRDGQRKSYATQLFEAEEDYLKSNSAFPACDSSIRPCTATDAANAERFLSLYMPDGSDPSTGQSYKDLNIGLGSDFTGWYAETLSKTARYYYNGEQVSHNIRPDVGQIFIAVGHYCLGDGRSVPGDGPLSGPDADLTRIVVLIGLERGGPFCLDNNGT
jgi:prepilin-type N-terminal cleavage/methylation domain-containing protein